MAISDNLKNEFTGKPYTIQEKFAIFGNAYGYLHTTSGQMRLWCSYSGAQKHLKLNFQQDAPK